MQEVLDKAKAKMQKSIDVLAEQYVDVRAGRANPERLKPRYGRLLRHRDADQPARGRLRRGGTRADDSALGPVLLPRD